MEKKKETIAERVKILEFINQLSIEFDKSTRKRIEKTNKSIETIRYSLMALVVVFGIVTILGGIYLVIYVPHYNYDCQTITETIKLEMPAYKTHCIKNHHCILPTIYKSVPNNAEIASYLCEDGVSFKHDKEIDVIQGTNPTDTPKTCLITTKEKICTKTIK